MPVMPDQKQAQDSDCKHLLNTSKRVLKASDISSIRY
jgi:hypothetical protein